MQRTVENKIESDSEKLQKLERFIHLVGNGPGKLCPVCIIQRTIPANNNQAPAAPDHTFFQCQEHPEVHFDSSITFTRRIKWPANSGICWRCGLWEGICSEAGKSKTERQPCKVNHIVVPIGMMAQYESSLGIKTLALAGQKSFTSFDYPKWLGLLHHQRLYGIRVTNAIVVLDQVAQMYC